MFYRVFFAFVMMLLLMVSAAQAQQPFITDDADVTDTGKFHFEFSDEFDILQRNAFPNLKQNTGSFELAYGLVKNLEIGIECPLLTIFNARGSNPETASGIGDINLTMKFNFLKERAGSRRPAMAMTAAFEIPSGDTSRQLGSGVSDIGVNLILQRSISERSKLRLNGGLLFSGNTLTGAVGLQTRGVVLTTGASLVRAFTNRLQLGVEVTGALARNADLGKGSLTFQGGGNYFLKENFSIDFGLVFGGHFDGSPRAGLQLGISYDF